VYWLKFLSGSKSLDLTPENGIYVSTVSGATGMTVKLNTSQGFGQIGETVESSTVSGRKIVINGFIFNTLKKEDMLSAFVPMTEGTLVWDDEYMIDVQVSSSPTITQEKVSKFSLTLFAPFPYWKKKKVNHVTIGEIVKMFSFPVNYSEPHKFGIVETNKDLVVINNGDSESAYDLKMYIGEDGAVNPILRNKTTDSKIGFVGEFFDGDIITISRDARRLYVYLERDGIKRSAFDLLDNNSSFYAIPVGESVLSVEYLSGGGDTKVILEFYETKTGVLSRGV
jgi:hypothetical protein